MIDNLLIVADSDRDADMLYAVGMFVPDAFIYMRLHGKCHIVMNDLEIDRARKQAPHCKVISWSKCARQLRRDGEEITQARIIKFVLRQKGLSSIRVSRNFPVGTGFEAFVCAGDELYLLCSNTQSSMNNITQEPRWLEAQKAFAGLTECFRADPLIV